MQSHRAQRKPPVFGTVHKRSARALLDLCRPSRALDLVGGNPSRGLAPTAIRCRLLRGLGTAPKREEADKSPEGAIENRRGRKAPGKRVKASTSLRGGGRNR